jgi:serine/alanine adding enzyme
VRAATPAEVGRWDDLVAANPDGGHILQTRAWGEFKARWHWRPRYTITETPAGPVATLFLVRNCRPCGELWYAPKGPGVLEPAAASALFEDRTLLRQAFLVQIEPELETHMDTRAWSESGWRHARHDVQITRSTILVDLTPGEDDLLASFKSKTRYNIRLAAKKGVEVRQVDVNDESIDVMYRLMAATQTRAGFTLRPRRYYEDYWRLQSAADQGRFFFAFLGDEVLAGIFVTYFGKRGWYKDGGSTRRHSNLMAPHLLQWGVMRWLKQRGVNNYDLYAVPPANSLNTDHPLAGLYQFKSGFSSRITEFVGTWELPLRKSVALWDRVGERVAHQWAYRVQHDVFY